MILIGQYDSPFVRRVAIAMSLYGLTFTHEPWSTFRQGDLIAPFNPLRRVPTLVLEDGSVIIESAYMLDYLDEQAGEEALIARSGPARRQALYYIALATGLADKAVSLFYDQVMHDEASKTWQARCLLQMGAVFDRFEQALKHKKTPWLLSDRLNHADIALGCAVRFVAEAHARTVDLKPWPNLLRHSQTCETLEAFETHAQAFVPPVRS